MKKKLRLLIAIPAFLLFTSVVSASKCEYSELSKINKEAAAVKVTYEEVKTKVEDPNAYGGSDVGYDYDLYDTYFKVNISNLTDNLYVKITNSVDNSTKTLYGTDAVDGVVSFNWTDLSSVANLTVKVYSSSNTSCQDEEILVNYATLPMYNDYSTWKACQDNKDSSVCKTYVTQEVTYDAYKKLADKQEKERTEKINEDSEDGGITKFVKKNKKGFIIGGSIIIVAGVVATCVVVNRRRRSRLI